MRREDVEELLHVVGERIFAESREKVAIASQPIRIASVETNGESLGCLTKGFVGNIALPPDRGHQPPQGLRVGGLPVTVEVESHQAESKRQGHVIILDRSECPLCLREISEKCCDYLANISVRRFSRIGIFGGRKPHERQYASESVSGAQRTMTMQRLPESFDASKELQHPEAESGLVIIAVSGEMFFDSVDARSKFSFKKELLCERVFVGTDVRRDATQKKDGGKSKSRDHDGFRWM
jgi:hypothetical protein